MRIGIDLTSLQSGHRMRGIGYTLINIINNIPSDLRQKHEFVFFYYNDGDSPLGLLDLEDMSYETRNMSPISQSQITLPGKLNLLMRVLRQFGSLKNLYLGDQRIYDLRDLDAFLQTDQMVSLPRHKNLRKAFVAYDLIPYILEWDYLWNYHTARLNGYPRKSALRCAGHRWLYKQKLATNSSRADKIFAISETTKKDFSKIIPSSKRKIITTPLGINPSVQSEETPKMHRYVHSSWGYLKRPYEFDNTPYLLFVGGADKRRRLDELATAFNHLRAQGHAIKLVLAGDSMQGPMNIATVNIQQALAESSYLDDIVFMGFVDDEQREWLYGHCLAFVFPSMYEGFGLPVLEAMSYGTPVIAYKNDATVEVAADIPLYSSNASGIIEATLKLLNQDSDGKKKLAKNSKDQASKFSWESTSRNIINELVED